jgi:hypothetical protein
MMGQISSSLAITTKDGHGIFDPDDSKPRKHVMSGRLDGL